MKECAKVEELLLTVGKYPVIANKLAKLIPAVVDEDLKVLLLAYRKYLVDFTRTSYYEYTVFEGTRFEKTFYSEHNCRKNNLDESNSIPYILMYIRGILSGYLEVRRREQKPSWQVMAERNGWVKP